MAQYTINASNLNFNTSTHHVDLTEVTERVSTTIRDYAVQTTNAEENYIYQDVTQLKNLHDEASILFHNSESQKTIDHINRFTDLNYGGETRITSNSLISDRLHDVMSGVTTNSLNFSTYIQNLNLNVNETAFTNFHFAETANGPILGSQLTQKNINDLLTGSHTTIIQDALGNNITINAPQNMQSMVENMVKEKTTFTDFSTKVNGNTISAFNTIKSSSIESIKTLEGVKGIPNLNFTGTAKDCQTLINSLARQISNCTDPVLKAKLQKSLDTVVTYNKVFAGTNPGHGLSMSQKSGLNLLSQKALGSDFYRGVNLYKFGGKIGVTGVRSLATGVIRLGMATASTFTSGLNLVAKHIPSPKISQKVAQMNKATHNAKDAVKTHLKENKQARKNHTQKELRDKRHREALDRSYNRRGQSIDRLEKRRNSTKDPQKRAKLDNKINRRQQRLDRLSAKRAKGVTFKDRRKADLKNIKIKFGNTKFGTVFNKIADKFKKVGHVLSAPQRALKKAKKAIKSFFKKIGKWLLAYIVKPCLIGGTIITVVIIIIFFGSSLNGTDLAGALENQNFDQIIVNATEGDLAKAILTVMKNDATHQFNFYEAATGVSESDNYDWYKRATNGRIGKIVASEDHSIELSSLNANIVPITNMMHYRYQDYIDYEHYATPYAYETYLYAMSKRVYNTTYEDTPACPIIFDYTNHTLTWDETTHQLNRVNNGGLTADSWNVCDNDYLHGYDKSKFNIIAEAKANAASAISGAMSFIDEFLHIDTSTTDLFLESLKKSQGVWYAGYQEYNANDTGITGTIGAYASVLYDSKGTCDNYTQFRWDDTPVCGITAHTHETSAPTTSGSFSFWGTGSTSPGGCYTWTHHYYDVIDDEYVDTNSFALGYSTTEDHRETLVESGRTAHTVIYYKHTKSHQEDAPSWDFTCTRTEHIHTDWSESNHGCYATAYVCLGHCGGHVQPVIDVEVDTEYETLMGIDQLSIQTMPSGLPIVDPADINSLENTIAPFCYDYTQFSIFMNVLAYTKWFRPLPVSYMTGFMANVRHEAPLWGARAVDTVTNGFCDLCRTIVGIDTGANELDETSMTANAEEDIFEFPGWWTTDASGNIILNPESYEALIDIYGEQYENGDTSQPMYGYAKDMWGELGDMTVHFSDGMGRQYSDDEVADLMKIIVDEGIPEGSNRYNMIKRAIESCGRYWLDYETDDSTYTIGDCGRANPNNWIRHVVNGDPATGTALTNVTPGAVLHDTKRVLNILSATSTSRDRWVVCLGPIANSETKETLQSMDITYNPFGGSYYVVFDSSGVRIQHMNINMWSDFQPDASYMPYIN